MLVKQAIPKPPTDIFFNIGSAFLTDIPQQQIISGFTSNMHSGIVVCIYDKEGTRQKRCSEQQPPNNDNLLGLQVSSTQAIVSTEKEADTVNDYILIMN